MDSSRLLASQGSKASSITDNGYIVMDNGLIIQWGVSNSYSGLSTAPSYVETQYPIPFPNKVFSVNITQMFPILITNINAHILAAKIVEPPNNYSFKAWTNCGCFMYIAIGY